MCFEKARPYTGGKEKGLSLKEGLCRGGFWWAYPRLYLFSFTQGYAPAWILRLNPHPMKRWLMVRIAAVGGEML